MNGIDRITAAIISEATEAAKAVTDEAKAGAENIASEYRAKAEKLTKAETERTAAECEAIAERARSSGALIRRNALLETKSALLESVFEKAGDSLIALGDGEYLSLLIAIFKKTLEDQIAVEKASVEHDVYGEYKAPGTYLLALDGNTDKRIGKEFYAAASKMASEVGKKLDKAQKNVNINGGFVLICGDIELTCSIPAMMCRIRSEVEPEVCKRLFA